MNGGSKSVLVVGGGASGMAAAYFAAKSGACVTLFEKNEKLGKKLYITGKGRCNMTNNSDIQVFLDHVISNPRFLYSAFSSFTSADAMQWVEKLGTPLKTERGNRVFPVSDHASDVIRALDRGLKEQHVQIRLNTEVKRILTDQGQICGLVLKDDETVRADAVILATGGLSYPSTGSTGDGYIFAAEAGHSIKPTRPPKWKDCHFEM